MKTKNKFLLFFYYSFVIIKYKIKELFSTNIRCWFGHKYIDTNDNNVSICKRCGIKTLTINAIYDEDE